MAVDPNAIRQNLVPLQPGEVEQPRVEQRPVVPVAIPEEDPTVGVAETALVPEKISIELTDTQQTQPTMALLKQFLTENGYEYKHVKNFSAQLPKNESGAAVLDTFTRKGPDGKEFTCFQGEMTFSVTVEKDGKKQTIEFSQKIETSVKVPMNGSDIEVEASMKKALFLIMGYRHTMGENFPQPGGITAVSNAGLEALKKLEGTASFKASTTKTGDPYSFYGRALRPTELPKDAVIKSLFKKTLEYYPSITSVTLGDGTQVDTTKYWNTKIVCPDMRQRSGQLDRFVDKMKTIGDDNEPIADINTNLRNNKPNGMTIDEALTVIIHNTQDDIYSLRDVGLKEDKRYIKEMVDRAEAHNQLAREIKQDIKELRNKEPDSPERARAIQQMEKQMVQNREAAADYSRAAIREKAKLEEKLEKINTTIAALEKLLKTDGVVLTETPGMNDEIKARHKENLQKLKDNINGNEVQKKINRIWVPESPGEVRRAGGDEQVQQRRQVIDLSEESSTQQSTGDSSSTSDFPMNLRPVRIFNDAVPLNLDSDSIGFQSHEDDSIQDGGRHVQGHPNRGPMINLDDHLDDLLRPDPEVGFDSLVGNASDRQRVQTNQPFEQPRVENREAPRRDFLSNNPRVGARINAETTNHLTELENLLGSSAPNEPSLQDVISSVNKDRTMTNIQSQVELATTNNTLTVLIEGLLSSNLSADDVSKIKTEIQRQSSTIQDNLKNIDTNLSPSERIAAMNLSINQLKQVHESMILINNKFPDTFIPMIVNGANMLINSNMRLVELMQRRINSSQQET